MDKVIMQGKLLLIMSMVAVLVFAISVNVGSAYAVESNSTTVTSLSSPYKDVNLTITSKTTGIEIKQEIATKLDGISPEDIVLLRCVWKEVKEQFPDELKAKPGEKIYYIVSPLSMGETFESGDTIDFSMQGANVHNGCNRIDYFCGENAISFKGTEKGKAKYMIGSNVLSLDLGTERASTGFSVSYIGYNPYDATFQYGFDSINVK